MSELDIWVENYQDCHCGRPDYHIYRCVRASGFDEEKIYVGARLMIDGARYEVCALDSAEGPIGDGEWRLVYAFHVPQTMDESEWHGLYGNPELANTG